jgi:hypothetical protein
MSALNFLDMTPIFSPIIMFAVFTDKLLLAFETVSSAVTGLGCGHEKLGYHALLIRLECCTINICTADISWKVISLQQQGYIAIEWQFHVAQIQLHIQPHNLMSHPYVPLP